MLQTQTVTADTLALTKRMMADPRLNNFVLVGGTALALTIGHRQSIDIDLFSQQLFDTNAVAGVLQSVYHAEEIKTLKNSVFCFVDGIKIDLIAHPYPEAEPHQTTEGIRIASLSDIAAMKLHAIVQSGTRLKDFVDIYFLLEQMPLMAMYAAYEKKYYPDSSGAVARIALNDTTRVNAKEEILFTDRPTEWSEIIKRLKTAIEFSNKIFLSTSQSQSHSQTVKKPQSIKRKRGKHL